MEESKFNISNSSAFRDAFAKHCVPRERVVKKTRKLIRPSDAPSSRLIRKTRIIRRAKLIKAAGITSRGQKEAKEALIKFPAFQRQRETSNLNPAKLSN